MTLMGMVEDTEQALPAGDELVSYLHDTHNHNLSSLWATTMINSRRDCEHCRSSSTGIFAGYHVLVLYGRSSVNSEDNLSTG